MEAVEQRLRRVALFDVITQNARSFKSMNGIRIVKQTVKGTFHVLSRAIQYGLGGRFKWSKDPNYRDVHSVTHIQRGSSEFKEGVVDLFPGALIAACVWCFFYYLKHKGGA